MEIVHLATWGGALGTRVLGEKVRRHVETLVEQGEIIHLDFTGVEVASPSFVDELVGKLFLKYGQANLRGRLRVVNASPEVQALVRRMVAERMKESAARGPEIREDGLDYQARSEETPEAVAEVTASVPPQGPELNPFHVLDAVQHDYLTYVHTFQRFQNPEIRDWVLERVQNGTLLWKPPFIQISRPFAPGDALEDLVSEGCLHPNTPPIFRRDPDDPASQPIRPYRHQSEAIRRILLPSPSQGEAQGEGESGSPLTPTLSPPGRGGKNVVVATGTGSGKSFCFGIPIVSECLRLRDRGVAGIKALVVYPMNALANSQYDDFARRLHGTGLTIARYTGDTAFSPAEALDTYCRATGREQPYDSEILSREEIQATPPDILMTNYVMLELLLTRFDDRKLFATPDVLRFLVLDEVHTYTGKRGADVAALIRRLKQHTHTGGKLRCIATSATVESTGEESAAEAVASFVQKLFGEPFTAENVVTESYAPLPNDLPPLTRAIADALADGPRTVPQLADDLDVSVAQVQQALLHSPSSNLRSLVPKLHAFFSQGRAITACLDPSGPHLNDRGESVCPVCAAGGRDDIPTFPLVFCRACGQEFWSVALDVDNHLHPADLDAVDVPGQLGYLLAGHQEVELPNHWLTPTGKVRKQYASVAPEPHTVCPTCGQLDSDCDHAKHPVTFLPAPFLVCPSCGIVHDRRSREYNKLFIFGSVGRSTATDVLVSAQVHALPRPGNKVIAFSDNRQDTALQAAHMNSLHHRFTFRQTLYTALLEGSYVVGQPESAALDNVGGLLYETQKRHDVLPPFEASQRMFGRDREAEGRYQRYLDFVTLWELGGTHRRTHQNLEDVGLLAVGYYGLDECAAASDFWADVPGIADLDTDARYDVLLGLLNLMRKRQAIRHDAILEPIKFNNNVVSRISEEAYIHDDLFRGPIGYSDTAERGRGYRLYRLTGTNTQPIIWIKRAFEALGIELEHADAVTLVTQIVDKLGDPLAEFLVQRTVTGYRRKRYDLWMINPAVITLQADADPNHWHCPKCATVHRFRVLRVCTGSTCRTTLDQQNLEGNYFRQVYATLLGEAVPVEAEEHSGQVSGQERREIELRFRDSEDPLNVLVCTPTMELGIDIGHLNAVTLRNVPPSPSNYAQRAGRAGRSGYASLISVFAGVGSARGPHDQYFYRFPEKMIAGAIATPRFRLDNEALITAHIHALVLETMGLQGVEKLYSQPQDLLDLDASNLPLKDGWRIAYQMGIEQHFAAIVTAVEEAFAEEIKDLDWFDRPFVEAQVSGFVDGLDRAMDRWREEYARLDSERRAINRRLGREGVDASLNRRRVVIEAKLASMREGKSNWYLYRYLGGEGFLPGYAFPPQATVLAFDECEDELARDPAIALTEYAPGNFFYYRGQRYEITHARPRTRQAEDSETPEVELDVEPALVCPKCQRAYTGKVETTRSACECGANLSAAHPRQGMALTDMYAQRRARITADEEERLRLGYVVTSHYRAGGRQRSYRVLAGGKVAFQLTLEHGGRVLLINQGQREREGDPQGFTLCTKCHRWLVGKDADEKHVSTPSQRGECSQAAGVGDLLRHLWLTKTVHSDLVLLDVPLPSERLAPVLEVGAPVESFYTTLLHTWMRALMVAFNLDENELNGFLAPGTDGEIPYRIVLYETSVGGSGVLASLAEPGRLELAVARARELLHGDEDEGDPKTHAEPDRSGGCERACYECLLSFYNQRDHHLLDRRSVLPWLRALEGLVLEALVDEDILTVLEAQCQSGLERQVLQAIHDRGLPLPDETQKTVYDGDAPIATVDFFYAPRILVFVDGSPHYRDYVQAADEHKRRRLKALGYRVVVVRAEDPEAGLSDLATRVR